MKKIIQFLIIASLFSCGQQVKKDTQVNIASDTLTKQPVENKTYSLTVQYNYRPDQKLTPWQGNIKEAAYWKDERGENLLIVSELPQYFWKEIKPGMKKYLNNVENTEVAELFAYHYIYDQEIKKWQIYWALNDFRFSNCDVLMHYLPGTLTISDLDSNGKAESAFSYYSALCTQPINLYYDGKLMLHIDSVKYSIKGLIGINRNLKDIAIKTEYSRNFSTLNTTWKTYSEKIWQRTIDIRDSLDKIIEKEWKTEK